MSEMKNLMAVARELLKDGGQIDTAKANQLFDVVMEDQVISTTERMFLKELINQGLVRPEAIPIIRDLAETKKKVEELTEVAEMLLSNGIIDKEGALELKNIVMEDRVLTKTERRFLEDLLRQGKFSPEAARVIHDLLQATLS